MSDKRKAFDVKRILCLIFFLGAGVCMAASSAYDLLKKCGLSGERIGDCTIVSIKSGSDDVQSVAVYHKAIVVASVLYYPICAIAETMPMSELTPAMSSFLLMIQGSNGSGYWAVNYNTEKEEAAVCFMMYVPTSVSASQFKESIEFAAYRASKWSEYKSAILSSEFKDTSTKSDQ